MTPSFERLLEEAREGQRDAAIALWEQATKRNEIEYGLRAAALLGYQTQLGDWMVSLAKKKNKDHLSRMMELMGLSIDAELIVELEAALKSANQRRRRSVIKLPGLLYQLAQARRDADKVTFFLSEITASGSTALLCGQHDGALYIAIQFAIPGVGQLNEDDEGYRDWMEPWDREFLVAPTVSSIWPEAFGAWDSWDEGQRCQAFLEWVGERGEDVIAIGLIEPLVVVHEQQELATPGSELLSPEENELLAKALALLEGDVEVDPQTGEHNPQFECWYGFIDLLNEAETPLEEIGLTLLNRALDGWPDSQRDGSALFELPIVKSEDTLTYIARSFDFEDTLDNVGLARLAKGRLKNAKILNFYGGPATLLQVLLESPYLENVRTFHWHSTENHTQPEWEEIFTFPIWSQLTKLSWDCPQLQSWHEESESFVGLVPVGNVQKLTHLLSLCPRIEQLELSSIEIDKPLMEAIYALPALETLNIASCDLTTEALVLLTHSLPPHLETFSFRASEGQELPQCRVESEVRLKHLSVFLPNRSSASVSMSLCTSPAASALESFVFDCYDNDGHCGLAFLLEHGRQEQLRTISINASLLCQEDIDALTKSGHFTALEELDIYSEQFNDSVHSHLLGQLLRSELPALQKIKLGDPLIDNAQLEKALSAELPPQLKELTLPSMLKFDVAAGRLVADWAGLQQLTRLSFANVEGKVYKRARTAILNSPYYHDGLYIDWGDS